MRTINGKTRSEMDMRQNDRKGLKREELRQEGQKDTEKKQD